MKTYDFIFAGAGLAGLSLACCIARSPLRGRSMLIVDQDSKQIDDRTFSYWSNRPGLFDQAISSAWEQLAFHTPGFSCSAPLGSYRYQTIRGIDLYRMAHQELAAFPNVDFLQDRIQLLEDGPNEAILTTNGQKYSGQWAFDSRSPSAELTPDPSRYHYLDMVFRGWEIETTLDVFHPEAAILMDFRTQQHNDVRFFYVLPTSERRALIEYTLFTIQKIGKAACQAALDRYLQTTLGLEIGQNCIANPREGSSLLMTDQPSPRKLGRRVLAIGLRGGRLKPTAGYAFTRIQRDSEAILHSLLNNGHPFDLPATPPLYPQLDTIMLEVFTRYPNKIPILFTSLFQKNPLERIFRFLDEDASLREIRQLIFTLPPGLFLQILARRNPAGRGFIRNFLGA